MVMIPPGHSRSPLAFSTWDDALDTMRQFVLGRLADETQPVEVLDENGRMQRRLPVILNLVPRPDNAYNPKAISVAIAPVAGSSHFSRHLGYLYDVVLEAAPALHMLATAAAPTPVGCHGWIALHDIDESEVERGGLVFGLGERRPGDRLWSWCDWGEAWRVNRDAPFSRAEMLQVGYRIERIYLDIPLGRLLDELVYPYLNLPLPSEEHYAARRGRRPGRSRPSPTVRVAVTMDDSGAVVVAPAEPRSPVKRSRGQKARDAAALKDLEAWHLFRSVPHEYQGIRAVTRAVWGHDRVLVTDRAGLQIGSYRPLDGLLTLTDERVRLDAIQALRAHGIDAKAPAGIDRLDDYPDAIVDTTQVNDDPSDDGRRWSILLVRDEAPSSMLPKAGAYYPASGALTVYARPHIGPLTTLLRRHGIEPSSVEHAPPPQPIIERNARAEAYAAAQLGPFRVADNSFREDADRHNGIRPTSCRLTPRAIGLVPGAHQRWLNAEVAEKPAAPVPDYLLDIQRRALARVFNTRDVEDRTGPCRLCGTGCHGTPSGIAYCLICLTLADRGVLRDIGTDGPWTDATIWALRRLAEIEFAGPPSRSQLPTILLADPDLADQAMLCRFLIPRENLGIARPARRLRKWRDWIELAGLAPDAVRRSRGIETLAADGHRCRSMFERHVDDFFQQHRIAHEVEPHYPRHAVLNTTGLRADWLLADGTFVEALGMLDDDAYAAKVQRKLDLVEATGNRLVTVRPEDVGRLAELFAEWMA
ncbi:hypothetical protein [Dactylosporangium cerinum]